MTRGRRVDASRIIELTREGIPVARIAEMMDCSDRSVNRVRVRAGLGGPAAIPLSAEEIAAIRSLLEDGCSLRETARTTGRSRWIIAKKFPEYGWTAQQGGAFGALLARKATYVTRGAA